MNYKRLYGLLAQLLSAVITGTPEQVKTIWPYVQTEMEFWLREHKV